MHALVEKDDYTPVIPVPKDAPAPDGTNCDRRTGSAALPHGGKQACFLCGPVGAHVRPATWDGTEWKLPRAAPALQAAGESPASS